VVFGLLLPNHDAPSIRRVGEATFPTQSGDCSHDGQTPPYIRFYVAERKGEEIA